MRWRPEGAGASWPLSLLTSLPGPGSLWRFLLRVLVSHHCTRRRSHQLNNFCMLGWRMNGYVILAGPFKSCLPLCTCSATVGAWAALLLAVFSHAQQRMALVNICGAGLKGTDLLGAGSMSSCLMIPHPPSSSQSQELVVLCAHWVGVEEIT